MPARGSSQKKELLAQINWRREHDNEALQKTARVTSEANATDLQSNPVVLSRLGEIIASRIGTAVRHVRSEALLKASPVAGRAIIQRRAYTKHWFEVAGDISGKWHSLVQDNGYLAVFVKSALDLRVRPDLESLLNEHQGNGFRAPYFFGAFTDSGLQIAAWEAIDTIRLPMRKYALEDLERIVGAIAGVNALKAGGTVPVDIRWVGVKPAWFETRYAKSATAESPWKDLYARTIDTLSHRDGLASKILGGDKSFLTHNDIGLGASNIFVPAAGDVVFFDWDTASLSVPGADLGAFTQLSSGGRLLKHYAAKMGERGFHLDVEQLRVNAEVTWGYRCLHAGWRTRSIGNIELGLRLLKRHAESKQMYTSNRKAPSPELSARISEYLKPEGRKLYQPIPHPAFSHLEYQNGPERYELIKPHLEYRNGTVLDIGSQWGYMAHRLEDLGYKVTAVEMSPKNAYFLTELRDLCDKKFEIIRDSVFNLANPRYDVVLALNIFHHFLKTEEKFRSLEGFLARLKCRMMIYQAHAPSEPQMNGAERYMEPLDVARFLSQRLSLPRINQIGAYRKGRYERDIYKLAE